MPITLGSNIASLASQRRLAEGTAKLSKTFERLSSGLRINSASDDAAGLAIADSLRAQTRISQAAIRNSNDAVSVVNIISSALDSQKGILTRMAELAEQAANGTYTYTQRKALDKEYQTLIAEYDRIAETTEFNGRKLLSAGSSSSMSFQVGIDGKFESLLEATITSSHSMKGVAGLRSDYAVSGLIDLGDHAALAGLFNSPESSGRGFFSTKIVNVVDSNGDSRDVRIIYTSLYGDLGQSVGSFSPLTSITYYAAEIGSDGDWKDGGLSGSASIASPFVATYNFSSIATGATASITIDLSDVDFQRYDSPSTIYSLTPEGNREVVSSPVNDSVIGFTNIRWATDARLALDVIANRSNELSLLQSDYGAIQSRLQTATSNLTVSSENFAAAESRIRDADIATESAELVRLNILQQAAASVLAQANQQPQLALNLLRNQ